MFDKRLFIQKRMKGPAQKKIRKEGPSVAKNDNDGTQSNENTLDSNIYLPYDILRIIFQYLNARNLASAAMVCRIWLEAANDEKYTRGPSCFVHEYGTQSKFLCWLKNKIRIKPAASFIFISDAQPYIGARHIERIEAFLPEDCKGIMLYSERIYSDRKYHASEKMTYAFLPQIPNVRIKLFKLTERYSRNTIWKTDEYKKMNTIINHETSNHKTSTCFMLFCNNMGQVIAKNWASAIKKSKGNKIVSVWGGMLRDIYVLHSYNNPTKDMLDEMDTPYVVAILITGSIQTWSTVLEKKCNTKEWVEARLKSFKDKVKLKKHSIGFMFAYDEPLPSYKWYHESTVESVTFRKLFPKIPLVGCFGDGEFGKTTIVDEVKEEGNSKEEHKCKKSESWLNESSTVFLILTYG